MKILEIQQNTEEWLEFRKGKSGGSEFKDLWIAGYPLKTAIIERLERDDQPLSPADKKLVVAELAAMLEPEELAELKLESEPKKKYYELIAERVARPITPNDYVDRLNDQPFSMMARGHILEPEAIAKFCEVTGKSVDPVSVVWVRDDNDSIYISPDAQISHKFLLPNGNYSGESAVREAVEVKCPGSEEVIKAYLTGKYPKEYEPQVIKYFVVNEDLQTLYFVIYTDVIPGLEIQIFEITREEVEARIAEAKAFEDAVMKLIDRDAEKIAGLGF